MREALGRLYLQRVVLRISGWGIRRFQSSKLRIGVHSAQQRVGGWEARIRCKARSPSRGQPVLHRGTTERLSAQEEVAQVVVRRAFADSAGAAPAGAGSGIRIQAKARILLRGDLALV